MSKSTDVEVEIDARIGDLSLLFEKLKSQRNEAKVGALPYRVIHLKNNPSRMAIDERSADMEKLRKENVQLRARLDILQSGCDMNVTREIDAVVDNANLKHELEARFEEYKRRENKIMSSFRETSRNFRKAVSSLTGYKMDALKDGYYKLFTDADRCDDDHSLKFKLIDEANLELIPTGLSRRYEEKYRTYVTNGDSFPAFIASTIMSEFNTNQSNATQFEPVSMCLSETIMPNSRNLF